MPSWWSPIRTELTCSVVIRRAASATEASGSTNTGWRWIAVRAAAVKSAGRAAEELLGARAQPLGEALDEERGDLRLDEQRPHGLGRQPVEQRLLGGDGVEARAAAAQRRRRADQVADLAELDRARVALEAHRALAHHVQEAILGLAHAQNRLARGGESDLENVLEPRESGVGKRLERRVAAQEFAWRHLGISRSPAILAPRRSRVGERNFTKPLVSSRKMLTITSNNAPPHSTAAGPSRARGGSAKKERRRRPNEAV